MPAQFDKDVSSATSQAVPELYRRGIKGLEYTRPKFFAFMGDGLYQSAISFFIPYFVYAYSTTHSVDGHDFSVWEFGTAVAVCAVTAANLFVGLHIRYWTWMVFVVIIASTLAIHVWIAIYSQFPVFTFQNELVCEPSRSLRSGNASLISSARRPLLDAQLLDLPRLRHRRRDWPQVRLEVHPVGLLPARLGHRARDGGPRLVRQGAPRPRSAVEARGPPSRPLSDLLEPPSRAKHVRWVRGS